MLLRGLLLLVVGALSLFLLLPGPHKPESFSLTDPATWWSAFAPGPVSDGQPAIPEDEADAEIAPSAPDRALSARAVPGESTRPTRRAEPASAPPEPAPSPDASLSERSRPGGPSGAYEEPEADEKGLSIAGSVLDDSGVPLPGTAVHARGTGLTAITDPLGMFLFEGLETGEYLLSINETARHHGTRRSVLAGAEAADLHLQRKGNIKIHGRVVDFNGQPVANATVRALGNREQHVTDASGIYEIQAELTRAGTQPVLDFTHPDYRDVRERVTLNPDDLFAPVQVDVVMDSEHEKVPVLGWVGGPHGEAVAGAKVSLSSQQPRAFYSTVSNERGEYGFDEIEIGPRYRIRVDPPDEGYQRYLSEFFAVGPDGAVHEVTLEASNEAELSGMLVNLHGQPVTDFTLWLRNTDVPGYRAIAINTDQSGYFEPVQVPAGSVQLGTRTSPTLSASGIVLAPGEARHVQIPLDWGRDWLLGRVLDELGEPVPQATIVAQWREEFPEVRSASSRQTLTDLEGYFNFANLAAPVYQVTVRAEGFITNRTDVTLQSADEVILRLRRQSAPAGPGDG